MVRNSMLARFVPSGSDARSLRVAEARVPENLVQAAEGAPCAPAEPEFAYSRAVFFYSLPRHRAPPKLIRRSPRYSLDRTASPILPIGLLGPAASTGLRRQPPPFSNGTPTRSLTLHDILPYFTTRLFHINSHMYATDRH